MNNVYLGKKLKLKTETNEWLSILPSISKILEFIMYNRLYNFLADHNIISKSSMDLGKLFDLYGNN